MNSTFEITHDRNFLQHFLTTWRTKSISPQMVEILKANSESDPYAAYGYGRWLSLVNPDGNSLKKAQDLLAWAEKQGVVDATAALSRMVYDGRNEYDCARPDVHDSLLGASYNKGSELAQYQLFENLVFGLYGSKKDPDLVADILQKHLEKNPEADPIYYDLLGLALESSDPEAAVKAFRTSLKRGNTESYYCLADHYRKQGDESKACSVAEEGARLGAVNCHRFKAGMNHDDFLSLSPQQQTALHQEIVEGLEYAITRHDTYACFLSGYLLYTGELGFSISYEDALKPLERGCEMGSSECCLLKAVILYENSDALPIQMRESAAYIARTFLQAARLGDREIFTLDQVAKGFVSGTLCQYDEEIKDLWLSEFIAGHPEEEDTKDTLGVILIYPQGFYYAMDVEEEDTLELDKLAGRIDASGFDIVHFSPILQRITKALCLDKESCHVAMLVDRDGYMKDLPDNMTGTLVYGQSKEIRGTVIFVLEDDKTYNLKPIKGLQRCYLLLELLKAATGNLFRNPTDEELESIGVNDLGGFEEYDDPDYVEDDACSDVNEEDACSDVDEDKAYPDADEGEVCSDVDEGEACPDAQVEEPREITVPLENLKEKIKQCNLCIDTLFVILPDIEKFWFKSSSELIYQLGIKGAIEKNIEQHGGYMIDEWQYVDARQIPIDIKSRVRFKTSKES